MSSSAVKILKDRMPVEIAEAFAGENSICCKYGNYNISLQLKHLPKVVATEVYTNVRRALVLLTGLKNELVDHGDHYTLELMDEVATEDGEIQAGFEIQYIRSRTPGHSDISIKFIEPEESDDGDDDGAPLEMSCKVNGQQVEINCYASFGDKQKELMTRAARTQPQAAAAKIDKSMEGDINELCRFLNHSEKQPKQSKIEKSAKGILGGLEKLHKARFGNEVADIINAMRADTETLEKELVTKFLNDALSGGDDKLNGLVNQRMDKAIGETDDERRAYALREIAAVLCHRRGLARKARHEAKKPFRFSDTILANLEDDADDNLREKVRKVLKNIYNL